MPASPPHPSPTPVFTQQMTSPSGGGTTTAAHDGFRIVHDALFGGVSFGALGVILAGAAIVLLILSLALTIQLGVFRSRRPVFILTAAIITLVIGSTVSTAFAAAAAPIATASAPQVKSFESWASRTYGVTTDATTSQRLLSRSTAAVFQFGVRSLVTAAPDPHVEYVGSRRHFLHACDPLEGDLSP